MKNNVIIAGVPRAKKASEQFVEFIREQAPEIAKGLLGYIQKMFSTGT